MRSILPFCRHSCSLHPFFNCSVLTSFLLHLPTPQATCVQSDVPQMSLIQFSFTIERPVNMWLFLTLSFIPLILGSSITNGTCYYKANEAANEIYSPCGNTIDGQWPCCQLGDKCNDFNTCTWDDGQSSSASNNDNVLNISQVVANSIPTLLAAQILITKIPAVHTKGIFPITNGLV